MPLLEKQWLHVAPTDPCTCGEPMNTPPWRCMGYMDVEKLWTVTQDVRCYLLCVTSWPQHQLLQPTEASEVPQTLHAEGRLHRASAGHTHNDVTTLVDQTNLVARAVQKFPIVQVCGPSRHLHHLLWSVLTHIRRKSTPAATCQQRLLSFPAPAYRRMPTNASSTGSQNQIVWFWGLVLPAVSGAGFLVPGVRLWLTQLI